jgi:DNA-binding MarR family transcriptional regulator
MASKPVNEALLATVSRRMSRLLSETGVADRGSDVLNFVFEGECVGVSSDMTALAAYLGASRGTAYSIVDDLVARGLLTKGVDPKSRRRTVLRLTEAGNRSVQATLERCVTDLLGIADTIKRMSVRPRLNGTVTTPPETEWLPPIRWFADWYRDGMRGFVPLNFLGRLNLFEAVGTDARDYVTLFSGHCMRYAAGAQLVGQKLSHVLRHYHPDLAAKVYECYGDAIRTGRMSVHRYEISIEGQATAYQRICMPLGSPPTVLMMASFFVDVDVGAPVMPRPSMLPAVRG